MCVGQHFVWPLWIDTVAVVSHLALAVSCSLSFYIYCALYRARRKEFVSQTFAELVCVRIMTKSFQSSLESSVLCER